MWFSRLLALLTLAVLVAGGGTMLARAGAAAAAPADDACCGCPGEADRDDGAMIATVASPPADDDPAPAGACEHCSPFCRACASSIAAAPLVAPTAGHVQTQAAAGLATRRDAAPSDPLADGVFHPPRA